MFPITVTISSRAQLNAVLAAIDAADPTAIARAVTKTEPKKEATPTSAQKTEAPAATQSTAQAAAAPEPKAENSAPPLTYEVVAKAILDLCRKKGNAIGKALLADFGANHGQDLKPEQYADVLAGCESAMKG